MSQPSRLETTPIKPRRWFQFSLRTALLGIVVLAVALGWLSDRQKLQEQLAQERAEKEALRAARDYEQGAALNPWLNPWWIVSDSASVLSGWQIPSAPSGGEVDEATVEHLKEYLGGDPCYQETVGGGTGYWSLGQISGGLGYVGSTSILRGDSIFGGDVGGGYNAFPLIGRAWPSGSAVACVRDVPAKDASAIPALVNLLQDQDATVRARAACTLARLGPDAKQALPSLLDRLTDADRAVRHHAAYALGRIRDSSPAVLTALREAMDDDGDSTIAPFAAQMLCRLDPTVAPIPRLIELLEHRDTVTRLSALRALASIGGQPLSSSPATTRGDVAQAIPRLKRLCSDADPATCRQAMIVLAHLASPAEAHAALGEIVRAGPTGDKEVWTFASLLWNRLDRQMCAAASSAGR